jgi:hypothetical protein
MKKNKKTNKSQPASGKRGHPTLLEFMASFHVEANKLFGIKTKIDPELTVHPLPNWGKAIMTQFGKTIMKPILKLRPTKKTTCEDYGKIIGVINRGITFFRQDTKKLFEAEGLDKISEEQWELIQPMISLENM